MSRIKHPSPALVVAILALVAAIAVPAYALTKREKRVIRNIAKAQANKRINARASEFTPAGEVHSPGRFVLNDPIPGDLSSRNSDLLAAGPFTVEANCAENFGGDDNSDHANLRVRGPQGTSWSVLFSEGPPDNAPGGETTSGLASASNTGSKQVRSGHLVAVAPGGQVVSVSASAEVNDPAADCIFGVTAVGP
jgi:hypothetical protein